MRASIPNSKYRTERWIPSRRGHFPGRTTARQIWANGKQRRATAVVELALVLPLLMVLLLGTLETCSAIYRQQTLHIAAFEGCRVALVPRITRAQVDAAINQILTSRRVRNATITITPANFTTAAPRTLITVRVDAPAAGNTLVTPNFFARRTFSGFCTMMKEF